MQDDGVGEGVGVLSLGRDNRRHAGGHRLNDHVNGRLAGLDALDDPPAFHYRPAEALIDDQEYRALGRLVVEEVDALRDIRACAPHDQQVELDAPVTDVQAAVDDRVDGVGHLLVGLVPPVFSLVAQFQLASQRVHGGLDPGLLAEHLLHGYFVLEHQLLLLELQHGDLRLKLGCLLLPGEGLLLKPGCGQEILGLQLGGLLPEQRQRLIGAGLSEGGFGGQLGSLGGQLLGRHLHPSQLQQLLLLHQLVVQRETLLLRLQVGEGLLLPGRH